MLCESVRERAPTRPRRRRRRPVRQHGGRHERVMPAPGAAALHVPLHPARLSEFTRDAGASRLGCPQADSCKQQPQRTSSNCESLWHHIVLVEETRRETLRRPSSLWHLGWPRQGIACRRTDVRTDGNGAGRQRDATVVFYRNFYRTSRHDPTRPDSDRHPDKRVQASDLHKRSHADSNRHTPQLAESDF